MSRLKVGDPIYPFKIGDKHEVVRINGDEITIRPARPAIEWRTGDYVYDSRHKDIFIIGNDPRGDNGYRIEYCIPTVAQLAVEIPRKYFHPYRLEETPSLKAWAYADHSGLIHICWLIAGQDNLGLHPHHYRHSLINRILCLAHNIPIVSHDQRVRHRIGL